MKTTTTQPEDIHYDRRFTALNAILSILQDYPSGYPEKCFNKLNQWFFRDHDNGGELRSVKVDIYHPRPQAVPHGVTNAPTLRLGSTYFKVSDQPAQRDRTLLVWINGGNAFREFRTEAQVAKFIRDYVKQAVKLQAIADAKPQAEPPAPEKAPAKPRKPVVQAQAPQPVKDEPRPTKYVKAAFTDAGLHAFWKRDSGGTWRIAVHEPHQSPDVALLVTKHIWNMMKTRGVRSALSIIGLSKEIETLEKEAA